MNAAFVAMYDENHDMILMLMMVDLLTLNWGLDIDMIMEEKTRTYCKITPYIEHHMSEKRTEN